MSEELLCYAHYERALLAGRNVVSLRRSHGQCAAPGCEGTAFFKVRPEEKPSIPQLAGGLIAEENSVAATAPREPLPAPPPSPPLTRERGLGGEVTPTPCDGTPSCPHCTLSRISTVSAYPMPLEAS